MDDNIDEIDVDNLCYDNEDEFSSSNYFSESDEDNWGNYNYKLNL